MEKEKHRRYYVALSRAKKKLFVNLPEINDEEKTLLSKITSDNIVYDRNIIFSDGTDLERHGRIKNLPNNKLRFTYYMNNILSIEEII